MSIFSLRGRRASVVLVLASIWWALAAPVFALTPNDPSFEAQWYLGRIGAEGAWEATTGTDDIIVAVIDTGVDPDHPDLQGNIWHNPREIPDGVDNDMNGYTDDVTGWDFVDRDNSPMPIDTPPFDTTAVSHGTLVAGIIGAVGNNAEGVAGVNWRVRLMSLRILDRFGSGTEDNAILALDYAVANGADVINLSFTGNEINAKFSNAIKNAYDRGVVVVAAVGNDGRNGRADTDTYPTYPACLKGTLGDDWVIGVAASTKTDRKADFSSYGAACTDITAPGLDMYGTLYQNDVNQFFKPYYGGGWQGTSAAAPVVSGAVALLRSRFPSLSPAEIKTVLQLAVDPVKTADTPYVAKMGAGRLNIARAMEIAPFFAPPIVRGKTRSPIIFAQGPGAAPVVDIFSADKEHLGSYEVYKHEFRGGVSAILADIDQDGVAEFAVVPRSNGSAHVRWFELDGTLRGQFTAFVGKTGGWSLAAGDVDGDGKVEFVVAPRDKGVNVLEVYDAYGSMKRQITFDHTSSGVAVSVGDVDGRIGDEIVLAPLAGDASVQVFRADGSLLNTITTFEGTTHGVSVTLGDLNRDGRKEIIAGLRAGDAGNAVRSFNVQGVLLESRTFGADGSRSGVEVAVGDLDGDGKDDLILADGTNVQVLEIRGSSGVVDTWSVKDVGGKGVEIGTWTF